MCGENKNKMFCAFYSFLLIVSTISHEERLLSYISIDSQDLLAQVDPSPTLSSPVVFHILVSQLVKGQQLPVDFSITERQVYSDIAIQRMSTPNTIQSPSISFLATDEMNLNDIDTEIHYLFTAQTSIVTNIQDFVSTVQQKLILELTATNFSQTFQIECEKSNCENSKITFGNMTFLLENFLDNSLEYMDPTYVQDCPTSPICASVDYTLLGSIIGVLTVFAIGLTYFAFISIKKAHFEYEP